jgi:hypothetical protein
LSYQRIVLEIFDFFLWKRHFWQINPVIHHQESFYIWIIIIWFINPCGLILLSLLCSSKQRYTWKRVDLWISRQFWMTFKEVHEYIVLISKLFWKEYFIPCFLAKKRKPIRPLSPRNRYPLHLRATFVLALLVNNTKRTNTSGIFCHFQIL